MYTETDESLTIWQFTWDIEGKKYQVLEMMDKLALEAKGLL